MKIPAWLLALMVIAAIAVSKYNCNKPEPVPDNVDSVNYDSVYRENDRLQATVDSLTKVTNHRDTVIIHQKNEARKNFNSAYRLSADSSIRLFIQWTGQFEDSTYRARYLRFGTDTIS